ncbi:AbrB family transcriptional regulator [Desulfitobacterium sp.]|uniref:AbrB family transcriptional regulator n=1 Tax=Desulfitobacterium sp. TaxID=49981 RepID=UPI002B1FCBF8|nr:AbrB family transcriptional regulator [Desulfitobacterium sp.]MEA4901028.1 AbrB family transcriptional regulator [Desulfitobacterium sp.]
MQTTERRVSKSHIRNRIKKVVIRNRNQITLPREYIDYVKVSEGEELEYQITDDGTLIFKPVVTIPRDQAWFWTEKWQAEEKEVDEEIRNGEINEPRSLEDFIDALKKL